jgi:hypothetical protein
MIAKVVDMPKKIRKAISLAPSCIIALLQL